MNQDWHNKNPFPEQATEAEKEAWRAEHQKNCNCGRMVVPYRQTARE